MKPESPPVEKRADYLHLKATLAVLSIVAIGAALVGGTVSALGFKKFGPTEQVDGVHAYAKTLDSAMDVRVSRLETIAGASSVNIAALRDSLNVVQTDTRFNSYLLCVLIRKSDPTALPANCRGK